MSTPTVHIYTFGYHRSGIPADPNGNGGGFVFDARAIENPGLEPGNMALTGHDPEIIYLLDHDENAQLFQRLTGLLVDMAVDRYSAMGYPSLFVAYGCTGGQHRSVYFAEKLARRLLDRDVKVEIVHKEKHLWP